MTLRWWRLVPFAAASAVLGCGVAGGRTLLYDMCDRIDEARLLSEVSRVDCGDPADHARLQAGWGLPERTDDGDITFAWAVAEVATVRLDLVATAATRVHFRCWPFTFPGAPTQTVAVEMNGVPIGAVALTDVIDGYSLAVPAGVAVLGSNILTFRFGYVEMPARHGVDDGRSLAVAFDEVAVGADWNSTARAADRPPPGLRDGLLVTPVGTRVTYTLKAPRDGLLDLRLDQPPPAGVRGEVWLRSPGHATEVIATLSAESPRRVRFELPAWVSAGDVLQVGIGAASSEGTGDHRPAVGWTARLYGRQRTLEPVTSVVLIDADTLRADHVGIYGGLAETGNLDRLAGEGTRFSDAYSHVPITGPSHASLFTSLLPTEHGVLNNAQVLAEGYRTLPERFAAWGYRTVAVISLGVLKRQFGFDQGFEVYVDEFGVDWMKDAGQVTTEVLERLGDEPRGPLFLWVHYSDPHEPYAPPGGRYPAIRVVMEGREIARLEADGRGVELPLTVPPGRLTLRLEAVEPGPHHTIRFPLMRVDDGRVRLARRAGWSTRERRFGPVAFDTALPASLELVNDSGAPREVRLQLSCKERLSVPEIRERYADEVEYMDREIGRLLAGLDERGVLERSLVVFLSDHGEGLGEHRHVGHISQLYEELIRVPLVFRWPSRLQPGRVVDGPVGLVDVAPTVLELVGLETPEAIRGRSLVAALDGGTLPPRPVIAATFRPEALTDKTAVVDDRLKLIHSIGEREWREVYDLGVDPTESSDLAAARPDLVDRLQSTLDAELASGRRAASIAATLSAEDEARLRELGYLR